MPYYVICPFYVCDRYPTKRAEEEAEKHPETECRIMTCCECARITPPTRRSRAFLYEKYCTSEDWVKCSIAQLLNEYYKELEDDEAKRIKQISH